MIKALSALALLAFSFMVMLGMSKCAPEQRKKAAQPVQRTVKALEVQLSERKPAIRALGRVKSRNPVTLKTEVAGQVLTEDFSFRKGIRFSKGDILLRLDDREARLRYQSAVSDLLNAVASLLPELKHDLPDVYETWNGFFKKISFNQPLPEIPESVSDKEKLFLSRFNIYKLYFAARTHEITLDKHVVKAPLGGTVLEANVRPGDIVAPGTPLGTWINLGTLEIEASIPLDEADWIEKNAEVTFLNPQTKKTCRGRVRYRTEGLSLAEQTVTLIIRVDEKDSRNLVDGMLVEINFPGRSIAKAVSVPRKAVLFPNSVYRIVEGRLALTPVTVAKFSLDSAYLTGGVSGGDTLVLESLQDGLEGALVQPLLVTDL